MLRLRNAADEAGSSNKVALPKLLKQEDEPRKMGEEAFKIGELKRNEES